MVVEEFHDQKIIYHLNIDEEVNNILMHLSSLKTIKTNRVIKGTTLVGAFYIFSLAFYSYLFHILFAWIFLLLSIGFAAIGLSVQKNQRYGFLSDYFFDCKSRRTGSSNGIVVWW